MLAVGSLALADDAAKAKVTDAIAKLKAADNYAWTVTTVNPNAQNPPAAIKGKTSKDGYIWTTSEGMNGPVDTVTKGTVSANNRGGDWAAARGGRGGRGGGGRGGRGGAAAPAAPATEADTLLKLAKDITAGDAGLFSGDYTDEGASAQALASGGRGGRGGGGGGGGGAAPTAKNAKGSVKFWVKDGMLVKYTSQVKGTVVAEGQDDRPVDVTRTTEIAGVGSTKFEIPAAAKAIVDAPPAAPQN